MFKTSTVLLVFSFVSVFLGGCGGGAQSKKLSNQLDSLVYEPIVVENLASGTQPLMGVAGEKKVTIIANEIDLALHWFNFTSEAVPEIDFNNNRVIIYERGTINLNNCGNLASLQSISAESILNNPIIQVNINYYKSRQCPGEEQTACTAVYEEGRPYAIVSLPFTGGSELFISEAVSFESCGTL